MIANTAFLAVLTVFLLVGWLAGEPQFLAPYWAALLHLYGTLIVRRRCRRLSQFEHLVLRTRAVSVPPRHGTQTDAHRPGAHRVGRVHEDLPPHLWSTRG